MFKVGALVKYDGAGAPVMARVEGFDGRRVRIAVLPEGLHLTVGAGDLALPGEDEDRLTREASAARWTAHSDNHRGRDGQGGYYQLPAGSSDDTD